MDRRPDAGRSFAALGRRIERAIRDARAGHATVNLSTRVNRSVVINTGRRGAQQAATSRQNAPIRQTPTGANDAEPEARRDPSDGSRQDQGGSKDVDARS
jgi:hypothetical protein